MHVPCLPRLVRLRSSCAGLLLSLLAGATAAQSGPQPKLATVPLTAGMHAISAEVARTQEQRQMGLMLRTSMAPHEGMLFVFDDSAVHCFWMRNTLLPLSIAFIADDGRIVDIVDMKPKSEESNCPSRPVRFALEMNKGWFAQRAIKPGFQLSGEPFRR
jgi:uncharacterized membrane protein (UPF0127 family)